MTENPSKPSNVVVVKRNPEMLLEELSDSFKGFSEVVNEWICDEQGKSNRMRMGNEYSKFDLRPARLGLGAKPQPASSSSASEKPPYSTSALGSVFKSIELKQKLTGIKASKVEKPHYSNSRPNPSSKTRAKTNSEENDELGRSSLIGKAKNFRRK